jgi:hypothetical protein
MGCAQRNEATPTSKNILNRREETTRFFFRHKKSAADLGLRRFRN